VRSFRDWGLRLKILVPVSLAVVVSGMLIASVLFFTSRKVRDQVLPKIQTVEVFRLNVLVIHNACRSYLRTPQNEHRQEISTNLDGLAEQLEHLDMVYDEDEPLLRELTGTVDQMRTVSKKMMGKRDALTRWLEHFKEKEQLLQEASMVLREGIAQRRRKLAPGERRDMRGQMRESIRLIRNIRQYLSNVNRYFLSPEKEGLIEAITEAESQLDQHLEGMGDGVPGMEEELQAILDSLAELRPIIAGGLQQYQLMAKDLVDLEQLKAQNLDVFDTLKAVVSRETESVFSIGQWLVYGVILFTLVAILLIAWYVAGKVGASMGMLIQATEQFKLDNLDQRAQVPSRDEVGVMADAFNQMADHLEGSIKAHRRTEEALVRKERLAAVGQLTATVSHELRNPLGSIRTSLAVIEKLSGKETPLLKSSLDIADRNIGRCDRIINDLLDFTRVRKLHFRMTEIDDWLVQVLHEETFPEEVTIIPRLTSGARIEVDRNHFLRALLNVFQNGCQAMLGEENAGNEKELVVGTRIASGHLEIYVHDTGPGIEPEMMGKVFEPLFSTKSFGVGLGLPTVKQIVEDHGGLVTLNSERGKGVEVIFTMPLEGPTQ